MKATKELAKKVFIGCSQKTQDTIMDTILYKMTKGLSKESKVRGIVESTMRPSPLTLVHSCP